MSLQIDLQIHFNAELVKRLLIRYFIAKGFDKDLRHGIYPPLLQDLPTAIPELSNRIEITPYALELDPHTGNVRLGWNLFALGNQRMFLGESDHKSMSELERFASSGYIETNASICRRESTPRRLIFFLSRILSNKTSGMIYGLDLDQPFHKPPHYLANNRSALSLWNKPVTPGR